VTTGAGSVTLTFDTGIFYANVTTVIGSGGTRPSSPAPRPPPAARRSSARADR
jgi:hypothetical protein